MFNFRGYTNVLMLDISVDWDKNSKFCAHKHWLKVYLAFNPCVPVQIATQQYIHVHAKCTLNQKLPQGVIHAVSCEY